MIKFNKYEGAGNDFVMINNLDGNISLRSEEIKKMCDRHFGIGADGVILVEKSDKADCFMNYYNSDGSIAEMCGNGVRCTADFYLKETDQDKKEINVDTRAGIKKITSFPDGTYSVNMGKPIFSHYDFPEESLNISGLDLNFVSIGNPHAVSFVENLDNIDLKEKGTEVENDKHFPNKINMELVERIDDQTYKVKVWERGSGVTLACGTGACAVYATVINNFPTVDLDEKEITLEFPGGNLYLSKNHEGEIILRGDAKFVFKGEL